MTRRALPALLAALALPMAAAAADGESLFKSRCSACHSAQKASAKARGLPEAERAAHLDSFIGRHASVDPAQRQALVQYLLSVTD